MTKACNLTEGHCVPCEGGIPALSSEEVEVFAKQLHDDWVVAEDNKSITRKITFKGFAKVVMYVNALSWMAQQEQHHADVSFGYGYCNITYSTHAIDGLSTNDFICAAKADALL